MQRIWDQAKHNAFTDLVRFQDVWHCTFREGEGHVGGDGKIRVLRSADGDRWESAVLIADEGIDLRDPKLSITVDNQLMLVAGGSVYGGTTTLKAMQPRVCFSPEGRTWSVPRRVMEEGQWLWRVTWHTGRAYGISYSVPKPYGNIEAKPAADWDGGNTRGWIGLSRPPLYRQWSWKETTMRLGGPEFIELPDRSLWAATRESTGVLKPDAKKGPTTVLARLTRDAIEPVLLLPSGGDTS